MKNKFSILVFSIFLILLAGSFEQVSACSCVRSAACQNFDSSDIAFVGKVVGSKYQIKDKIYESFESEPKTVTYDIGEIYFEVTEAFKGQNIGSRLTIHSSRGGGSCGYMFERGKSYVVFASKSDKGEFWTGLCSGTRELSNAETALSYLKNLPKNGDGGLFFGRIDESIKNYSAENLRSKPMPNVEITAQQTDGDKKIFSATTDANGLYEIKVPPGEYILSLRDENLYFGNKINNKPLTVADKQCELKDFYVVNNSRIEGKIIDAEGKLAKGFSLHLIPADKKRDDENFDYELAYIGEDGKFSFSGLSLGSYLITLNYTDKPDNDSPYTTVFYPNTTDRSQAQVFEIGYGTKFEDLVFQLPPKLIKQKIYGQVFWKDGIPAQNAQVQLKDVEFDDGIFFNEIKVNDKGEFELE